MGKKKENKLARPTVGPTAEAAWWHSLVAAMNKPSGPLSSTGGDQTDNVGQLEKGGEKGRQRTTNAVGRSWSVTARRTVLYLSPAVHKFRCGVFFLSFFFFWFF
jgi:hypothetical protein